LNTNGDVVWYDGTLPGLFSTLYYCRKNRLYQVDIRKKVSRQCTLFEADKCIPTVMQNAERIIDHIKMLGGESLMHQLLYLYFADTPDHGTVIFEYLKLIKQRGPEVYNQFQHPVFNRVQRLIKKVSFEHHRFKGFVRFEELAEKTLWSTIAPTHNIIYLLVPHFKRRLPNETFVLFDSKRAIGVHCKQGNLGTIQLKSELCHKLTQKKTLRESPDFYTELWKKYFRTISIPSRKNLSLQMQLMPKKYWEYLPEKV